MTDHGTAHNATMRWWWYAPLLAAAPIALFAERFPLPVSAAALAITVIPSVARKLLIGTWLPRTELRGIILSLLILLIPLSIIVSPLRWEVTFPRTVCLVWSIAVFHAVVDGMRQLVPRRGMMVPVVVYLAAAVIPTTLGMLSLQRELKFQAIGALVRRLPDFSMNLLQPPGGAQANELAGMLTLIAPVCLIVAIAAFTHRGEGPHEMSRLSRLALAALALFFAGALILTQSRGAWGACLVALVCTLAWYGRAGHLAIAAVMVAAGIVVVTAFPWFRDVFLLPASIMGLTTDTVLTGRPELWRKAMLIVAVFPYTGAGLGTFGYVLQVMFPTAEAASRSFLPDAHDLPLQTAIDFGIPGSVLMLGGAAVVLRHAFTFTRRAARGTLERSIRAGLFAGLVAFALFNVTDAIAFGSKAGLMLWLLLGLTISAESTGVRESEVRSSRRVVPFPFAAVSASAIVALVGARAVLLPDGTLPTIDGSRTSLWLLSRLTHSDSARTTFPDGITHLASDAGPGGLWLAGLYYQRSGDLWKRDSAWSGVLSRTTAYTTSMQDAAPFDTVLARAAVVRQPGDAESHLWLGRLLLQSDSLEAETRLRACVRIDPRHGLGWRYLGDALKFRNPHAAIRAYENSCRNGDPGANGCMLAGLAEEALGDYHAAIRYYRMSRWPTAHARADSLEHALRSSDARQ